jgi:hypothetical protein
MSPIIDLAGVGRGGFRIKKIGFDDFAIPLGFLRLMVQLFGGGSGVEQAGSQH